MCLLRLPQLICLCAQNLTLKWTAYFRNILYVYTIFLQTSGSNVCMCSMLKAHTCASWERRAMLKANFSPLRGLRLELMEMTKYSSMCVTQEMTGLRQVKHMLKHLLEARFSIVSSTTELILCTYLQNVNKLFYYRSDLLSLFCKN